jgi:UDP:flavonoid glycosyltransferase YjiC (YdhE family)
MKILVSSVPLMGHLNPLLSIASRLIADGHEVVVLSATALKERVERSGASFRPFSGEADRDLRDFAAAYPEFLSIPPGVAMTRFYFERVFADPLVDQFAGIQSVLSEFPADVILADNLFLGVLPLLLGPRSARPAIIYCGTTYLLYHREDGAPINMGLPLAGKGHYRELAVEDKRLFLEPFSEHLNAQLARVDVGPLESPVIDAVYELPEAHLQLTVPGFEFPRSDLPSTVHFVGATPIIPGQAPLPAWASELDGSRKVVFVTQGTLSNHDFMQLVVPAMTALADEPDVLVVVTAGGRPVSAIPGVIPLNVRLADYLPFEWLLPKVDLLVTNGGYGSVNQALSFGIPLVTAGLTEDKADVNARVEWSGAGIDLRTNSPSVADIRTAVRSVLKEPGYRDRARILSAQFRAMDTHDEIAKLLVSVTKRP